MPRVERNVALPEGRQETRAPFDIGEQERHRARREVGPRPGPIGGLHRTGSPCVASRVTRYRTKLLPETGLRECPVLAPADDGARLDHVPQMAFRSAGAVQDLVAEDEHAVA